jgi:hypothetical protein
MRAPPLATVHDDWFQASYKVRVRETMYLWGSAGVTENIMFHTPLLLHIRNDVFGEPVTFGTQVASGTQTPIGTLQPGECVSIPMQGISGVFAKCGLESTVDCLIKASV